MSKTIEQMAEEFAWNEVCYQGLEYSRNGNIYPDFIKCFLAGAQAQRELSDEKHLEEIDKLVAMGQSDQFEMQSLTEKLEIARDVAVKFMRHGSMCMFIGNYSERCTCGFDEAKAELEKDNADDL